MPAINNFKKGGRSDLDEYLITNNLEKKGISALSIQPSQFNFKGTDTEEPIICKTFGCKKHLNLSEQLMGSICFNCSQKTNVIQPSKFIQY